MENTTRQLFNAYIARQAELNGIDPTGGDIGKFAVTPSVEQKLEDKIQESSSFLSKINIIGVRDQIGDKLGLGVSGPIASRTDTEAADRATRSMHSLDERRYTAYQTNFDTHIRYAILDAWAKFPDFQRRVSAQIVKRIALDRMTIGWNGTSAAATTDIVANPLLQDLNIGWLQHARTDRPENVIDEVVAASSQVRVGANGDYANLDALVFDMVNSLLAAWYQEAPGLVCILGRELMADKYFPMVEQYAEKPSEAKGLDMMLSAKRVGGLQAVTVPFFPARSLVVTTLDNLSIYYQNGTRRRHITDNPKRDRVETYESVNESYVVEDYDAFAACENIVLPDGAGGWA